MQSGASSAVGRRSPTATTPPTEPATTIASEGQIEADAALLVLSDFPSDWTEEVEAKPTEQDLAYRAAVAACAGATGDDLLDLGGPRGQSPDFVGPDDERVEQSVTIVDPAVAEDLMVRFSAPGSTPASVTRSSISRPSIRELGLDDPSRVASSSPDAVTVGDVTIEPLDVATTGDELAGYGSPSSSTTSGITVDAFVDAVLVRVGGSLSGFTFQSVFEPFPDDDIEHYIGVAVERLPGEGAAGGS